MQGALLLVVDSPSSIYNSNFQRKSVGTLSSVPIAPPTTVWLSPEQQSRQRPEITFSSGHQRSQATLFKIFSLFFTSLLLQWRASYKFKTEQL
jgi:hypothetical protein